MFQIDRNTVDFHEPLQPSGDEDKPVAVNPGHVACAQHTGKFVALAKIFACLGIAKTNIGSAVDQLAFRCVWIFSFQ